MKKQYKNSNQSHKDIEIEIYVPGANSNKDEKQKEN